MAKRGVVEAILKNYNIIKYIVFTINVNSFVIRRLWSGKFGNFWKISGLEPRHSGPDFAVAGQKYFLKYYRKD